MFYTGHYAVYTGIIPSAQHRAISKLARKTKLKASLQAQATRTREALEQALTEALQMITAHDARGWFARCGYCAQSN